MIQPDKLKLGQRLQITGSNGEKCTCKITNRIPAEKDMTFIIRRDTGDAFATAISIHSIDKMRVTLFGIEYLVPFDAFWILELEEKDYYEQMQVCKTLADLPKPKQARKASEDVRCIKRRAQECDQHLCAPTTTTEAVSRAIKQAKPTASFPKPKGSL